MYDIRAARAEAPRECLRERQQSSWMQAQSQAAREGGAARKCLRRQQDAARPGCGMSGDIVDRRVSIWTRVAPMSHSGLGSEDDTPHGDKKSAQWPEIERVVDAPLRKRVRNCMKIQGLEGYDKETKELAARNVWMMKGSSCGTRAEEVDTRVGRCEAVLSEMECDSQHTTTVRTDKKWLSGIGGLGGCAVPGNPVCSTIG